MHHTEKLQLDRPKLTRQSREAHVTENLLLWIILVIGTFVSTVVNEYLRRCTTSTKRCFILLAHKFGERDDDSSDGSDFDFNDDQVREKRYFIWYGHSNGW